MSMGDAAFLIFDYRNVSNGNTKYLNIIEKTINKILFQYEDFLQKKEKKKKKRKLGVYRKCKI